ncbi:Hypp9089 [Branchiostoma lanceolatum]|uniref:Hypp9089 protein n=1 Tax=Branchiostoma lanceolatum TaxID=7740 RepID=A0A8J9ZBN4_BRALA|nr:Hypp9089 [Branchiostoma lanceolatum]
MSGQIPLQAGLSGLDAARTTQMDVTFRSAALRSSGVFWALQSEGLHFPRTDCYCRCHSLRRLIEAANECQKTANVDIDLLVENCERCSAMIARIRKKETDPIRNVSNQSFSAVKLSDKLTSQTCLKGL